MSTIITKKQFPNYRKYSMDLAGRPLTLEVGKLAELANAAVLVTYGETTVLVTATAAPRPRDGIDFFPLSVDFEEKLYACLLYTSPQCYTITEYDTVSAFYNISCNGVIR